MTDLRAASADLANPSSNGPVLASVLAAAVLAVPGVVRLEPTLSTAGPSILLRRDPADGVRLTEQAGVVDVDVDIATTATCEARAACHQVRSSVADVLHAHGRTAGAVTVNVLTIDPG